MGRVKKAEVLQLDSFLDIVTNTIGILVVICCMASININDMTYVVRTPFVHSTDKYPVFFECRKNRCVPVNKDNLHNEIDRRVKELFKGKRRSRLTGSKILSVMEGEEIADSYYKVDLNKLFLENVFVLIPRGDFIGELSLEIRKPDSVFSQIIKEIDTEKEFAFFLVRPDGFGVYREARKILWKSGVEVGWEPMAHGKFISFGTKGRKPHPE